VSLRTIEEVATTMWGTIATLVVVLVLVLAAIGVAFFVGMRTGSPFVRDIVRRFNRALGNPYQMKTAGTPGAYASVIQHAGRSTGRPYATPMVPFPTDDGFVIALPYGPGTDWVKNVMASGSATIVHDGNTYRVVEPELVRVATAAPYMPEKEQRSLRRFAVDQCLRVRHVDAEENDTNAEQASSRT
jgi:deazaflavin-dependent oxidoreductase (nitroreductase family)